MPPVKILVYDFLRRHYPYQVIGSKFDYFLSACKHKLPCICSQIIIHPLGENVKRFLKKTQDRTRRMRD